MPNHCENHVMIKGNHKDLMSLKEFLVEDSGGGINLFSANKILPMPKELEGSTAPRKEPDLELIKKYGSDNWYDWCVKNWGTKWGTYDTALLKETPRTLHYVFTTAWSPPFPLLAKLSELYPELRITDRWHEEGGCKGVGYFEAGETTEKGD